MSRIRVLQVLPNFGLGGGERVALHLLQGLDRNTFELAAVSLYDEVSAELAPAFERDEIPLYLLGKRKGPDPRMFPRFDRILRGFDPHVVHTHRYVLRYCLPALLRRRTPVRVHTVHNPALREVDRLGRVIHRVAFATGVVPVAIADAVEQSLLSVYGARDYPLIPNGIPVATFRAAAEGREGWRGRNGFGKDDVLFVALGRLEPQKNLALLLRSFAIARRGESSAHLLFAGDGFLEEALRGLSAELNIEESVHFLGFRDDVSALLGACDVLAVSSDWEGNPLSVMEAMAAGLPIVSTEVGGVPELVEDGVSGLLVPPGDGEHLAAALRRLLLEPATRRRLGAAASERAEQLFDVQVMVDGYARLYRRLLSQRRPSLSFDESSNRDQPVAGRGSSPVNAGGSGR